MKKIMKKGIALSVAAVLTATTLWGCGSKTEPAVQEPTQTEANEEAEGLPSGIFTGEAAGFGGEVTVAVTLENGEIAFIEAFGDAETPGIGSIAIEQLPDTIVKRQTTDVDVITSATITSNAIIEAVNAALVSAGIDPASLVGREAEAQEKTAETLDVDVVIVGGGGAGMTAAITVKQAGLDVIIIEKMPMVGGNTLKATGGMNAAETKQQAAQGVEDTIQTFVDDTMEGGYHVNNIDLVTAMAENSAAAIDWLETIGAPLPKLSFSGGATNSRIHAPEDGSAVGTYLVEVFSKNVEDLGIPVYLNTAATEIMMDGETAVGVKANSATTEYTINASAVILATGGFGANEDMYASYKPELKGFVTTNTPGATGEGLKMAESIGANLVDIEQIQIHPTVEQETSIMITESVRGGGAILVNQNGERFTDELLTRDVVSAAVMAQEGNYAYLIFDQQLRDGLKAVESYVSNNIVEEAETLAELAALIDMDGETLAATLADWNEAVASQNDEAFGRNTGMDKDITVAPYYAIKIAPGVHHTMGGVEINTSAQVINVDGEIIPGLFAAGEVTGGIHGANRIGGNAVADIVVFGRIAGASVVAEVSGE